MKTLNLSITSLAYGGAGVGRHEGKVCFVPYTAPGDEAVVRLTREKRGYCEGELVSLLTPSPERTEPDCPLFGRCGGCTWQHLAYDSQVRAKEEILRGFLSRLDPSAQALPLVPSPRPFGYRNRIQLKVRGTADGVLIGFYRRGSHFVIDIADHCPLASPWLNAVLPPLRSLLSAFPARDRVPQVDVVHGDDGRVHLTFHVLAGIGELLAPYLLERQAVFPESLGGLHLQSGRKDSLVTLVGENELFSRIAGAGGRFVDLGFTCDGFSQVNSGVNALLVAQVAALAAQWGGGRLLDLYCGNGNLSLPLASLFREIEGVEGYPPSIDSARRNAISNGIGTCRFHVAAAEDFLQLVDEAAEISLALLDPPREGARLAVERLAAAGVPRILYVSCDPATLARDGSVLCRSGYALRSFRGFDMFPQTYHIEPLALFETHR
jgi:23S rRNA (uracil1939-C5)-methyltransferase